MKIAVCTHYDNHFAQVGNLTSQTNWEYCQRHGYEWICERNRFEESVGWHIVWDKILLLKRKIDRQAFPNWFLYIDADAMILNHTIKLESLIDPEAHLIIANDINGLNSGVFLIRNSQWSLDFLNWCWGKRQQISNRTEAEQTAMKRYLKEVGTTHVKFVSPNMFNSYLYSEYGEPETTEGNYKPGDFILHLPGMANNRRVELLTEYREKVIR